MKKYTYRAGDVATLQGIAYWRADIELSRQFADEKSAESAREPLDLLLEDADLNAIPFWVQNKFLERGENVSEYKALGTFDLHKDGVITLE